MIEISLLKHSDLELEIRAIERLYTMQLANVKGSQPRADTSSRLEDYVASTMFSLPYDHNICNGIP